MKTHIKNLDLIDKNNLFHPITNLKAHSSEDLLIVDRGEVYIYTILMEKNIWKGLLDYGVHHWVMVLKN